MIDNVDNDPVNTDTTAHTDDSAAADVVPTGTETAPAAEPKTTRAPRKRAPRAATRAAGAPTAVPPADSTPTGAEPLAQLPGQSALDLTVDAAPTLDAAAAPVADAPEAPGEVPGENLSEAGAEAAPARKRAPRKRAASKRAATVTEPVESAEPVAEPVADSAGSAEPVTEPVAEPAEPVAESAEPAAEAQPAVRRRRRAASAPTTAPAAAPEPDVIVAAPSAPAAAPFDPPTEAAAATAPTDSRAAVMPLFQAPAPVAARPRRGASRPAGPPVADAAPVPADDTALEPGAAVQPDVELEPPALDQVEAGPDEELDDLDPAVAGAVDLDDEEEDPTAPRRRRRRGGRGRRGRGNRSDATDEGEEAATDPVDASTEAEAEDPDAEAGEDGEESSGGTRRRRRRRRRGSAGEGESEETGAGGGTRVRAGRRDVVEGVRGSTRLEAKKQRRREGREAGRRRTVLSEAEFLARRESVERVMVVREREGRTQIGVLEDGVLVEHYVARQTQTAMVGNVYLGRVQNVLPSMEAAFVDIGKGRNAVLYAGEVNWDAAGLDGQPRRIEHALKAGESVLVQVTKDPIGHKGARLTSQISLPGRFLVLVPDGSMTGISRKLPDTERSRLRKILREIVPDDAGVIVRTAAEGATDEELQRDVARLLAHWEDLCRKKETANAPALLYGEPDLAIRVVRDIFNEDFAQLIVSGDDAWDTLHGYVSHVAPDLEPRLQRWSSEQDVFAAHRIDEQLAKGLDRKVWLPSGGSLVIDRTEAMTVIDVNTGKFTGSGGNLEETVTRNNLEAAEEVVRQLRLRDIGGIIVVDFIDMVLESNRDLVLRRLLECLGRDRTRHQVAEVTSLGLVQMTRKRVGQGLIEVFSESCEHCSGRGVIMHTEPVEKKQDKRKG